MFHSDDHAPRFRNQVHGSAYAFDHFVRDHPVGNAAGFVDFHRAHHAKVNMTAANHRERIGARKVRGARQFADRFFPRVDQVGVFRAFECIWPDAEVDVESVAQFAGNALHDAFAFVGIFWGLRQS
jgi:hypothetical protein